MRFDLKKRKPSALYDSFSAALELLSQQLPTGPKRQPRRFLDSWSIDKEKCQMTVTFTKAEEPAGRADAPHVLKG